MADEKTFTLTKVSGYLQVPDKPGRKANKKRWCWFDETTCSLKYYKDLTSYKERSNEPLGEIYLASAKITPPFLVEGTNKPSNQFGISTDEGLYQLQAKDNKEALEWIRKLQDKTSEYYKASSAREHQDEATKTQTIPRTLGRRGLLAGSPDTSPVGVRKIMEQILTPSPSTAPHYLPIPVSNVEALRRASADSLDVGALQYSTSISPPSDNDATDGSSTAIRRQVSTIMTAEELKLEYYKSQETSTMYYKEVQKLKQKLEQRDLTIQSLNEEIANLKEQISSMSIPIPVAQLQEEKANLQLTLKQVLENIELLVKEVDRHREQSKYNEKQLMKEREKNAELERNINIVKKKYVQVLVQSLPINTLHDCHVETSRNPCLVELLKEEGWETEGVFDDEYGDIHDWNTDTNVQHFLCRYLYLHYTQHEQEELSLKWVENIPEASHVPQASLTTFENKYKTEFRDLLRQGLPAHFRELVWTSFIKRHVAKIREVKENAGVGVSYYRSLLTNCKQKSHSCKIIELDLLRTMPANKFFKQEAHGITQLENVLTAYSIHNKNVGYCQGMNFVAALGLLYLDEEATFWYMVAIIDKILPGGYYNTGLLGAQADQAVLQELLAAQIPDLNEHLSKLKIDITVVTFNWFLTIFTDAMPTEGALRIMDVFLYEGHKVLYRMAIGILKLYKERFLSMTDPISMFQYLKALTRHTYNIEELFAVAFTKEFPSRSHLASRHSHHLNLCKQDWEERQKEAQVYSEATAAATVVRPPPQVLPQLTRRTPHWECGCCTGTDESAAICLCSGEKDQGVIAVITVGQEPRMEIVPDTVMKGRAVCMKYVSSCDIVLIGTLDFYVYAVDCLTWKELWSLGLLDSVLNIEAIESTVFFALAEGSLAIIKNIDRTRPLSEPLLLRIGSSSVPCLTLVPNQMLWCGSEKSITVLSTVTCELEKSIVMDDGTGKIYKMRCGQEGVWVTFRSSTIICLFDVNQYTKLLQVDYATLPTSETHDRITSLLPVQGHLWVGTGDGTIHILSVKARESKQKEVRTSLQADAPANPTRSRITTSCGLVATPLDEGKREEGEREEQRQEEDRHGTNDLPPVSRERRTKFGAALHNRRPRPMERGAYELTIEASRHVVESRKEPVRTLQTCLGPDNTTIVVSSVHTDSDRAVQMWRCSDQNATNWDMVYLQCSEK